MKKIQVMIYHKLHCNGELVKIAKWFLGNWIGPDHVQMTKVNCNDFKILTTEEVGG